MSSGRYYRSSVVRTRVLTTLQKDCDKKARSVLQSAPHRWNSMYHSMNSILALEEPIRNSLAPMYSLSDPEWLSLKAVR